MLVWVCTFLFIIHFSPLSLNETSLETIGGPPILRLHLVFLSLLPPLVTSLLKQRRNSPIRLALLEMWSRLLYSQAPKKVDIEWARSTPSQIRGATESCFSFMSVVYSVVEKVWVSEEMGGFGELGSDLSATSVWGPGASCLSSVSLFIFKMRRRNTSWEDIVRIEC